jgi:hypothetical protein
MQTAHVTTKPRKTAAKSEKAQYVTETELAEILSISVHTLRRDRRNGRRFPFVKLLGCVRYNLREVLSKIEANGGL